MNEFDRHRISELLYEIEQDFEGGDCSFRTTMLTILLVILFMGLSFAYIGIWMSLNYYLGFPWWICTILGISGIPVLGVIWGRLRKCERCRTRNLKVIYSYDREGLSADILQCPKCRYIQRG